MSTAASREPIPVDEIVDFDDIINEFKLMLSGQNRKKIMFIVARDGRGKTSLLRKIHRYCQSKELSSCLIDLSETYDFPHLELAKDIYSRLGLPMTSFEETLSPMSAPLPESAGKMEASTEIHGNVIGSTVETKNIVKIVLSNENLQSEDIKRRLTRKVPEDISSTDKTMVCLFDTFDEGTRAVEDWLLKALLRPIRDGGLSNAFVIVAGSAWPKKINDMQWANHAEFKEGLPMMSKAHLSEFAKIIGCDLSENELDTCWLACGKGRPLEMNMIVKNICNSKMYGC